MCNTNSAVKFQCIFFKIGSRLSWCIPNKESTSIGSCFNYDCKLFRSFVMISCPATDLSYIHLCIVVPIGYSYYAIII